LYLSTSEIDTTGGEGADAYVGADKAADAESGTEEDTEELI